MADELRKLACAVITKIDESKHEIWGLATEEIPDSDNEIFDYETSAPLFEEWSKARAELTDGISKGVLREMHQLICAGRLIDLTCDPINKRITIGAKVINADTWEKISEKCLIALSIGGRAINKWKDKVQPKYTRFTAKPTEISVVDVGAVPTALIGSIKSAQYEFVKADGSTEMRSFKTEVVNVSPPAAVITNTDLAEKLERVWSEIQRLKKGDDPTPTKRVAGEDLKSSAFAYVGDPKRTETWKLPLHFSSEEKSKRHVRNALARFNQTKGIPDDKKAAVWAKIVAAAKKYGIEVSEEEKKATSDLEVLKTLVQGTFKDFASCTKSMQNIQDLVQVLQTLRWVLLDSEWEAMYEGSEGDPRDEAISVEVRAAMEHLIEILKDVVDEETSELAATSLKAAEGVFTMKLEEISKAANSLHDHFKKAAAHHEKLAGLHKAKHEHHMAKAVEHETAANSGLEEMKSVHKSMAATHKFDAEHHAGMHKAHTEHAAHLTAMAEKCMGKAEEVDVAKAAAEAAAAEAAAKAQKAAEDAAKAAGASPDFAKLFGDLTKSMTDSIGALKSDVETLKAAPASLKTGITMVPRPNGEDKPKASPANYNSIGI